jgi:hypothetical protein
MKERGGKRKIEEGAKEGRIRREGKEGGKEGREVIGEGKEEQK